MRGGEVAVGVQASEETEVALAGPCFPERVHDGKTNLTAPFPVSPRDPSCT